MEYKLNVNLDQLLLVKNIISGILKPVNKLINQKEIYEILNDYTFQKKTYALPYIFFVHDKYDKDDIIECYYEGHRSFTILVEDCFLLDLKDISSRMFGTTDVTHPGVNKLTNSCAMGLSGFIFNYNNEISIPFDTITKCMKTVFQSRNPPHKAHEEIISKYAPNLLYTTPFTTVQGTDYSFEKKMQAFLKIKEKYKIELYVSTLPRVFGGPREALQNCIIFQNQGVEEFIMGRGKNCIGNFYDEKEPYMLCKKLYQENKIDINPIWIETMYSDNREIRASNIKSEYIDKGLFPPNILMSEYISEILLSE